jgi:1-deoxy-D-xylulose-5-phosphate reductoisomerase
MRLPILYALSYPERLPSTLPRIDWRTIRSLDFEQADMERFPCLRLAYDAIERGGNMPCLLNAANEVANLAFREGRCTFMAIPEVIEQTMQKAVFLPEPSLDDLFESDNEARRIAASLLG